MSIKKSKSGKGLSGKDAALWKAMTGDVARMPGRDYAQSPSEPNEEKPVIRETVVKSKPSAPKKQAAGAGLDRRSDDKLRRGQMKIEARLDLHGMSQAEAHAALGDFLVRSYERGRRCVLVITGKGSRSKEEGGVLRKKVPQWLKEGKLAGLILAAHPAKPKDGGEGAMYVLLRRQRDVN